MQTLAVTTFAEPALTFSDGDAPPSLPPVVERGRFASGAFVGVFATAGPLAGVGPGGCLDQSTEYSAPNMPSVSDWGCARHQEAGQYLYEADALAD